MRILHVSDCGSSGEFMGLYEQADVVVATGDLDLFDFIPIQRLDPVNRKLVFAVYGNHDAGKYMPRYGMADLHRRLMEYGGFRWFGFQGCLKYKESPFLFTEDEARAWADSAISTDILLLHAPPYGLLDDLGDVIHTGSPAVRDYVLTCKPSYVFCGHVHSNASLRVGETVIYRTYGARLIEIS